MGPLRERNFLRLFADQPVSRLGNSLVPVALAFVPLDLTNSPAGRRARDPHDASHRRLVDDPGYPAAPRRSRHPAAHHRIPALATPQT